MLLRLTLDSWAQAILLPQPPEQLELQAHTTAPGQTKNFKSTRWDTQPGLSSTSPGHASWRRCGMQGLPGNYGGGGWLMHWKMNQAEKSEAAKINSNSAYASLQMKSLTCFSCYVQIRSFKLEMFWKKNLEEKSCSTAIQFSSFFFFFPFLPSQPAAYFMTKQSQCFPSQVPFRSLKTALMFIIFPFLLPSSWVSHLTESIHFLLFLWMV